VQTASAPWPGGAIAGMVIPLVLFFGLLGVVGTCWYYRRRNTRTVNLWDMAPGAEEDPNEERAKDKTRAPFGNDDMSNSSGGAATGQNLNDIAGEKRLQRVGLLEPSPPQYTVQG